jgi:hypothetical protein
MRRILNDSTEVFLKVLTGITACRMSVARHWLRNIYGEDIDVKTYNKSDKLRWASANKYTLPREEGGHATTAQYTPVLADKPGEWFWVKCGDHEWKVYDKKSTDIPAVRQSLHFPLC